MFNRWRMLPGFAPADEVSFDRAQDRLFVSAKGPKIIHAPFGLIGLGGCRDEGGPTRQAQTRPAKNKSILP